MNHFIKLIPVSGPINNGDWYAPAGELRFLRKRDEAINDGNYYNCQRYKYFLCNNNIELFDDFIFFSNGQIKDVATEIELEGLRVLCNLNGGAKVIGQIDPDAIVKDGDQYTDEDITIIPLCPHYDEKHLWKDCSCKSGFVDGVVIKNKTK